MKSSLLPCDRYLSPSLIFPPESLEHRRLLAAECFNNHLRIEGTAFADTIVVRMNVAVVEGQLNAQGWVQCANATMIEIRGMDGNDDIQVAQNVLIGASIHGDAGNDSIIGGGANDLIWGDADADVLSGGGGDDLLDGGDGGDILLGGVGDDVLQGQAGADQMSGEDGNDNLTGGAGMDYMFGNAGDDYFNGFDGEADYMDGGAGYDASNGHDPTLDTLVGIEQGTD